MYQVEYYEARVLMEEYLETCVSVEEFLECCRSCGNYGKLWSCPPYDFKPEDYWKEFRSIYILGHKIIPDESVLKKERTEEERRRFTGEILGKEKRIMAEKLFAMEEKEPGSVSLSAGCCSECRTEACTRRDGHPCRNPERMRYSLESLGANVGLTIRKYLKQELLWIEEGKLPEYFILAGGLLRR